MANFKIEFNEQQLTVLNNLLMDAQYKIAAPIVNHINAQIQKAHDLAVDDRGSPTGATSPPDMFAGD